MWNVNVVAGSAASKQITSQVKAGSYSSIVNSMVHSLSAYSTIWLCATCLPVTTLYKPHASSTRIDPQDVVNEYV